jgi:uncharacterized protein (DUF952 family)
VATSVGRRRDLPAVGVRKSLEDEGYIHCSFAKQVQAIADLVYHGRRDVVLLEIDPPVCSQNCAWKARAAVSRRPHIYGPLPVEAVIQATDVPLDAGGRLMVNALLGGDGPRPPDLQP